MATPLFSVDETAQRIGHYAWFERRLFEVMGAWVASVPELTVKYHLGTYCHHHGFHAELWHRRLPELREMNPATLTAPPNAELVRFVEALTPDGADRTIEKLVGLYRVALPQLIAAYRRHRNHTTVITDGPTIRWLDLCLHDDMEEWREGEILLQSLLNSNEAIDRAAEQYRVLASLLHDAGGIGGPEPIGP